MHGQGAQLVVCLICDLEVVDSIPGCSKLSFLQLRLVQIKPFPNDKIDPSKLKEFADDNFKFDGNDGKFPKWIKNTVAK